MQNLESMPRPEIILVADTVAREKNIDKEDVIAYKKNKYDCHVLINNVSKIRRKYKDVIIDKITIQDLMVLMIKGERK